MDPAQNSSAPPTIPPNPIIPGQPMPAGSSPAPVSDISSTEISLAEAKKLEHHQGDAKKKKIIIGMIIAVILFLFLCIGIVAINKLTSKPPLPKPTPIPTPTIPVSKIMLIDTSHHEQILIPYVSHFLDLSLSDIVNINDIRGIFNYKDHLVIVSFGSIVEYNPKTNEFLRQNDPRTFTCVNYATLIGNLLYVGCNGWDIYPKTDDRGIYVINLDTGKVEKIYKEGTISFANITLANTGNTLWVGGRNEVALLDTKKGTMREFDATTIGIPQCKDISVFANDSMVWASCREGSASAISIFDSKTNTWSPYAPPSATNSSLYTLGYTKDAIFALSDATTKTLYTYDIPTKTWNEGPAGSLRIPSSKPEADEMRANLKPDVIFNRFGQTGIAYLSYFDTKQKKVIDFELFVHPYIGMSDVVNEKHYLFTQNTIDTLKDKEFPTFYKKLTAPLVSARKVFVDASETYAVVIGTPEGASSSATVPFSAQLIQIKTGAVLDLLKNNESLHYVDAQKLTDIATQMDKTTLVGDEKTAKLQHVETGKTLLQVDFKEKKLTIQN